MISNAARSITLMLLILFGFAGGYVFGQSPAAPISLFGPQTAVGAQDDFLPLWEVYDLLEERYFEQPLDTTRLAEGAIDGMLASLGDQHTRYLSPEDEAAARSSMAGEFEGIGAEVENIDGNITIVAPIDGSPAAAANLQPGDILREANGVELTGMDITAAAGLVRGPAGTTVTLLIQRGDNLFEVDIVRDVIKLASVRGEMLEEGIAYIRLSRFANDSATELENMIADMLTQNPAGLILDLRRNPGGSLDTTVDIADLFLPEGTILIERFGDGAERIFESTNRGIAEDIPMVVLIDEGSASASELLAGALQDRGRSVLIGQTTFGKGTVQTWQPLSNGGGVRITIAQWLTPNRNWIHENGLEPDYFIPLPNIAPGDTAVIVEEAEEETADPDEFIDTQLEAAIKFLQGETIISIPPQEDNSQ